MPLFSENVKQSLSEESEEKNPKLTTQELVERGYRRFGKMYFRPICKDCHECQSIKIDVANYLP